MNIQEMIKEIDGSLPCVPTVRQGGSLLMMVGLPGSGKSSIVRGVRAFVDCIIISTDGVRTQLSNQPTYTPAEMSLVYEICYTLIEGRLRQGQRVVFDASNYLSARRERLFRLVRPFQTPVAVCYVQAKQEVIQLRLKERSINGRQNGNLSDADWSVYKWMLGRQEPVRRDHLVIDTTTDSCANLAQNLHQYWLKIEANAACNRYL